MLWNSLGVVISAVFPNYHAVCFGAEFMEFELNWYMVWVGADFVLYLIWTVVSNLLFWIRSV